jgi:carbon monoxide dehydrogenase subunit G
MEFRMEAELPSSPAQVWLVMVDIGRMASCIPGCEQIEEREKLKLYSAVMKQKIGPFKLEVPAEIVVEEHQEPRHVRARAFGKDKITGTTLDIILNVELTPSAETGSRLDVHATLQVAGRLASLGYSIIKKKAEENFALFEARFRTQLETI